MKRLMCAGLATVALLAGPAAVHAEGLEPTPPTAAVRDEAAAKLRLARRFIAALQTDQMAEMLGGVTASLTPPAEGLTPTQQEALQRAAANATTEMTVRLFDAMTPIYADIFTMEELTALVDFYESDVGRSMMEKSYAAAPRVTELVMEMMPEMMQGMVESMCKDLGCTDEQRARMNAGIAAAGYGGASEARAAPKAKN